MKNNTKETIYPPLPQLGVPTGTGGPWDPATEEEVYFTVRFQPTMAEHWRCHRRILWVRPGFTVLYLCLTLGYGVTFQLIGYVLDCFKSGKLIPIVGKLAMKIIILPVSSVIGMAIAAVVFQNAATLFRLWDIHTKKPSSVELVATNSYISCNMFPKATKLLWKEVVAVLLNHGDLYVLGPRFDSGFYIPRRALGDAASTELLYDAIYSLWKSNGHGDALSPEMQKRFGGANVDTDLC